MDGAGRPVELVRERVHQIATRVSVLRNLPAPAQVTPDHDRPDPRSSSGEQSVARGLSVSAAGPGVVDQEHRPAAQILRAVVPALVELATGGSYLTGRPQEPLEPLSHRPAPSNDLAKTAARVVGFRGTRRNGADDIERTYAGVSRNARFVRLRKRQRMAVSRTAG